MIRIAHFSDIHFSKITLNPFLLFSKRIIGITNLIINRKKSYSQNHLKAFDKFLKSLGIDLIFITGDLTSTSLKDEFKKAKDFISLLDLQTFIVPGNHDQYTKNSYKNALFYNFFDNQKGHFSKSLKNEKIEVHELSDKWFYIGLDTCVPSPFFSCSGFFSKDLENHLLEVLKKIPKEKNIIITNHYPVIHDAKSKITLKRKEALLEIIKNHPNVKLYLHGHTHKLSFEKISDSSYMACSGCISYKKNASFNIVEIEDNSFRIINYALKNNNWEKDQIHKVDLT
ncbi:MAG: metallophosphoesterase [Parachlamydiales bacterium]|jgi:3',5'-cyclic AMP phosphodiesterase CpdA